MKPVLLANRPERAGTRAQSTLSDRGEASPMIHKNHSNHQRHNHKLDIDHRKGTYVKEETRIVFSSKVIRGKNLNEISIACRFFS